MSEGDRLNRIDERLDQVLREVLEVRADLKPLNKLPEEIKALDGRLQKVERSKSWLWGLGFGLVIVGDVLLKLVAH